MSNNLLGVAAISGSDVWAVGSQEQSIFAPFEPLIEHFDGSGWSIVQGVALSNGGALNGVAAKTGDDVWGVGWSADSVGNVGLLAEHWDGSSWTAMTPPNPGTGGRLQGVAEVSPTDVWAVGNYFPGGPSQPVIVHWDGTAWSVVPSPNPGSSGGVLMSVAAASANDVWAVGENDNRGVSPLVEHWDGTSWSMVSTPVLGGSGGWMASVSARSSSDVWGVGIGPGLPEGTTLAEHWNGTKWRVVPSPNASSSSNQLFGLVALARSDVWAVGRGDDASSNQRALALHWDGSTWSLASLVDPSTTLSSLSGAAGLSNGRVWAVGNSDNSSTLGEQLCPVRVSDAGFKPHRAVVSQGSTVAWKFASGSSQAHSVTDGSGIGLFDSGLRTSGNSYTYTFAGAGGYTVIDSATSQTSRVNVPAEASPSSGGTGTTFTVQVASVALPAGLVEDIQIQRPGSASFVDWQTGVTNTSASFVPDAGSGTYLFRARLRDTVGGASTHWSPATSIIVS